MQQRRHVGKINKYGEIEFRFLGLGGTKLLIYHSFLCKGGDF